MITIYNHNFPVVAQMPTNVQAVNVSYGNHLLIM